MTPPPSTEAANGERVLEHVRRLLATASVDRTVAYSILNTFIRMGAGSVTAILVGVYFSPLLQGFYFTFASLLALQIFAELGLSQVLIQFASHEWSDLALAPEGHVVGAPRALSRLGSLARLGFRWYSVAALLAGCILALSGNWFFSSGPEYGIAWELPWLALCATTAVRLWLLPVWALLEGCNQVLGVYRFRVQESLLNTCVLWAAIPLGGGLWAPALASGVTLAWHGIVLLGQYPHFIAVFRMKQGEARVDWWHEVWPMQWRMALTFVGGYLMFSVFVPLLFHYRGPAEAGQMGMSWTLVSVIGGISSTWLATRAPRFGILIARSEWQELDRLFRRLTVTSVVVALVCSMAIWLLVYALNVTQSRFAQRLLPPLPLALYLLAAVVMQCGSPLGTYLRAHKREPLMAPSVVAGAAVALACWLTARPFGALGMGASYLAIQVVGLAWATAIFTKCRREWHVDAPAPGDPHTLDVPLEGSTQSAPRSPRRGADAETPGGPRASGG